jgi:hypothetical protein
MLLYTRKKFGLSLEVRKKLTVFENKVQRRIFERKRERQERQRELQKDRETAQ